MSYSNMSTLKSSTTGENHRYAPYPSEASFKQDKLVEAQPDPSSSPLQPVSTGHCPNPVEPDSTSSGNIASPEHQRIAFAQANPPGQARRRAHPDPESDGTSYVYPNKVRAVAGPQQQQIDYERAQHLAAVQELKELRRQYSILLADNKRLKELGEAHTRETSGNDTQDSLIHKLRQKLTESIESLEEAEVTIALQRDSLADLEEAHREAVRQKENIRASSSALHDQAKAAVEMIKAQEEAIARLQAECQKAQQDKVHQLRKRMQRQSPQNSLSSLPSSSVTSSSSNSTPSANQPSAADSQKLNSSSSSTSRPSASQPSAASPQNSNSSSSSSSSPSAAAGNPPTATPTPSRKRKCPPKPGSQSYSQQIKDSAFATTKFESDWRKLIRSVFLSKTGMPNVNSFQTYSPVEDPIANAYEKCRGPGPEGMTQNLYFFGEGWKNSRWNRDVLARRASEVVAQQENYRIPGPCLANDVILACLKDCLKQAQASWKRNKPRIHFSGERYETPEEAQARARTQEGVRSSSVRVYTRKATKYKTRLDALDELLKDSTLTTFTRRKWEFARDIVHNLGKDGQSSEDTDRDDDELPLVTTVPHYRRRIVGELLQEVDREAARLQWKAATLKGKHAVVRAGKIHRRSTIQSHRSVARKLPEALYHRGYLQSLTPYEKELLQINKEISMPMFEVDMFRQESNSEVEQDPE